MNLTAITDRIFPSQAVLALVPFADAVSGDLPLSRLARLSLFQLSVGMALVLLNGTLNRVMVLEMGQSAWLVSLMVSLPLFFAPLRALVGFRSDHHKSLLGWRRVPYIWGGSMTQFGGLAIMPFALIVLADPAAGPQWLGPMAAALAFLLVGAGLHITQTAGLALATDLATDNTRPKVVALLYVMLLVGTIVSALLFSVLLDDFSNLKLIKVIQGTAIATIVLNAIALWRQESLMPSRTDPARPRPSFSASWGAFTESTQTKRLLLAIGLGTAAFSMQDILLEPYGGEILGMSVSATTGLSAIWGLGMLIAFALSSRRLSGGADPIRLSGYGASMGLFAFAAVILSAPLNSPFLFKVGAAFIGLGGGFFAVGTLTAAMALGNEEEKGLALGAWGAVQATAAGLAIALGGALRDYVTHLAVSGNLGSALMDPATGYSAVYHLEILLLFAALIALGPLVRGSRQIGQKSTFALHEFPN
ncbi:BCD family MFS transporter [Congregibacter litoralis]|uniref:Arabinose efflux permease n=1 Tax=Congregibacter litoralis KT71 TaxID=314285 RepID=A4ACP7_9GAMM|nr:BCD family MFS transporter [Congregibacter litoralis]EAQ96261.1 Arabinose efflux permease [Congregibacter litoralis KT71]